MQTRSLSHQLKAYGTSKTAKNKIKKQEVKLLLG